MTVGATLGVLVEEESDIAAIQAADASEFGVAEAGAQTVAAAEATAPAASAAATPPRPGSGELQRLCSAVRCDPEYYRCISCESCSQFDSLP